MSTYGVVVEQLEKRFGSFRALKGVDFVVAEGTVVGLLGPNGAGKTTTINILTTLLRSDGGHALVAGFDVDRQPQLVRSAIGLTGQYSAVDEDLTGRENLVLVGRLGRMPKRAARARADELLELFDLADASGRLLRTYSGGMRRRLDLGASLMVEPAVLFLDEPTTGLDPRSRLALWDVIGELRRHGTTIVLTTQYMEEADHLCDRISVIDGGLIIAEGTADELKDKVGGDVVHLQLHDRREAAKAAAALAAAFHVPLAELICDDDLGTIQVPVASGAAALVDAVRALDAEGLVVADLGLRRPSLDDVFLGLTGHLAEEARPDAPPPRGRTSVFRA
jgi:ABC-2 type transport system ATP-binding protein